MWLLKWLRELLPIRKVPCPLRNSTQFFTESRCALCGSYWDLEDVDAHYRATMSHPDEGFILKPEEN